MSGVDSREDARRCQVRWWEGKKEGGRMPVLRQANSNGEECIVYSVRIRRQMIIQVGSVVTSSTLVLLSGVRVRALFVILRQHAATPSCSNRYAGGVTLANM